MYEGDLIWWRRWTVREGNNDKKSRRCSNAIAGRGHQPGQPPEARKARNGLSESPQKEHSSANTYWHSVSYMIGQSDLISKS